MKHSIVPAVLACLFVGIGVGSAQQAVTIKIKTRGKGDTVVVAREEKTSVTMTVMDAAGKVMANNENGATSSAEYLETILNREGKKHPTLLERDYTKVVVKQGDKEESPLQGRKVVIEKKGANYTFTYKGGEAVAGNAATILMKEFSHKSEENLEMEKLVLPRDAVKPGDSWKPDMGPIVKEIGDGGAIDIDTAKATGLGKLEKVYVKDGKLFGEMKFKLDFPVKAIGKGDGRMTFADGAKATLDVMMDTCIDGTSAVGTMRMKMHLTGNATTPQLPPGASMAFALTIESQSTLREPGKK